MTVQSASSSLRFHRSISRPSTPFWWPTIRWQYRCDFGKCPVNLFIEADDSDIDILASVVQHLRKCYKSRPARALNEGKGVRVQHQHASPRLTFAFASGLNLGDE